MEATRQSGFHAMDWRAAEQNMSAENASMPCSVIGDLSASEGVDAPSRAVSMQMPLSLFA